MPDDVERQLEAFGRTLETETGEPIGGRGRNGRDHGTPGREGPRPRTWAMIGAAACVLAAVGGLIAIGGRDAEAPVVQRPASTSASDAVEPAPNTTIPTTIPELSDAQPVGDDPLGLERDGWTLVQRATDAFAISGEEFPCEVAGVVEQLNGVGQVHDILTPPDASGLDLDIQILDVGSLERGLQLADFVDVIGRCVTETRGIDVETGSMSSVRATWFRAGTDFALVAIVGDGRRSIVLEIEGAPFDDDLIGDLVHRSDQFLRGVPVTGAGTGLTVTPASELGSVEPGAGQAQLWVSNQSFDDDPVAITIEIDDQTVVDASFDVDGQHNWIGFMIDGLEPGEHTLTATSDTGAAFEDTFTLPPDEPRWMVVDYWYEPDGPDGRRFTFTESDEPIYFA